MELRSSKNMEHSRSYTSSPQIEAQRQRLRFGKEKQGRRSMWRCLRRHMTLRPCSDVVEVRGIEPLSESVSSGTSPGADGNLHSLAQARAVTLESLVAS